MKGFTGVHHKLHKHPAPPPSANSKTNKERVTEFLHQAVDLPKSDCSIFTENEGLAQIKVTTENEVLVQIKVIITLHDCGPDYTLH